MILATALNAYGHHPLAWRTPGATADRASDGSWFASLARMAEAATLDFVSFGYPLQSTALASPERGDAIQLDPLSLASATMTQTHRIGLCAAVATAYWAPFNIARAFSSFDNLAEGRAAWLVDGALHPDDAKNTSASVTADVVQARNREFLQVTRRLWDSWEDDAIVLDKENARFTDAGKVHRIDHRGAHFTVEGPLNAPRPVQGRPPIVMADQSEPGLALAAEFADVLLVRAPTLEAAAALSRSVKTQARACDRYGTAPRVLVDALVATSEDLPACDADSLSWRGPAAGLADLMQAWTASGACDGFNLLPASLPGDLIAVTQTLIPELRRRRLVRDAYEDETLREHLGLTRPASVFSHAGA